MKTNYCNEDSVDAMQMALSRKPNYVRGAFGVFTNKNIVRRDKDDATYGCPNCDSFKQQYGHDIGTFNVDILCLDCGFVFKDVNPNQPYGVLNPIIFTDGSRTFHTHPLVVQYKKQAKRWRTRREISALIDGILAKL